MPSTYTTIQGDMWDLIAYKAYGNERQMRALLRANEAHRHTAIFPAGVTLVCPEPDKASPRHAPPWRR